MALRTLTDLEHRIIDFAHALNGRKITDRGVYERLTSDFGWRPVTFQQRLNALLDDPAAQRDRPLEIRLLREKRARQRRDRLRPPIVRAG
jgi:hypothetical protein